MNIKLAPPKLMDLKPRITVIGIGGAGCNAINNMIATRLDGVEFVVANTDAQSLSMSNAERRIQLGTNLTEGLGAGARPEIGEAAAREAEEDIKAEIAGSHMVFIAAGMGGGTGTGAASVIAEVARDLGILSVGIVSKPFQFEGARRMRTADAGIEALEKVVDTLIVIPNQNLFRIANERTTFAEAFRLADQVLYSGIACIVDLIVKEGLINLDFADVQAVMKGMGTAMMGTGEATGEDRALTAANEAIANPLLDNITLSGAQGLLISIVGGADLTLYEVDTAASHIRKEVASDANIIVGATTEEGMDDRIRVSIVASGMSSASMSNAPPQATFESEARASEPSVKQNDGARSGKLPLQPVIPNGDHAQAAATQETPVAKRSLLRSKPIVPPPPAKPSPELDRTNTDMNVDEADEFARALSEAMAEAPAPDDDDGDMGPWRSADGVLVEEGFAGANSAPQPPPLPSRGKQSAKRSPSASFAPVPPATVPRASTRMPEVSDFPEIAQREYFAKMEDASHTNGTEDEPSFGYARAPAIEPPRRDTRAGHEERRPTTSDRQQPYQQPQDFDSPPARTGLLRRLTGGNRK